MGRSVGRIVQRVKLTHPRAVLKSHTRRLMALWCMTHFPPFPQQKKKKKGGTLASLQGGTTCVVIISMVNKARITPHSSQSRGRRGNEMCRRTIKYVRNHNSSSGCSGKLEAGTRSTTSVFGYHPLENVIPSIPGYPGLFEILTTTDRQGL